MIIRALRAPLLTFIFTGLPSKVPLLIHRSSIQGPPLYAKVFLMVPFIFTSLPSITPFNALVFLLVPLIYWSSFWSPLSNGLPTGPLLFVQVFLLVPFYLYRSSSGPLHYRHSSTFPNVYFIFLYVPILLFVSLISISSFYPPQLFKSQHFLLSDFIVEFLKCYA